MRNPYNPFQNVSSEKAHKNGVRMFCIVKPLSLTLVMRKTFYVPCKSVKCNKEVIVMMI